MTKLKLQDINQAAEAVAAGQEVEFYLVLPEIRRRPRAKKAYYGKTNGDTRYRLGLRAPSGGTQLDRVYVAVRKLTGADPTQTATRDEIEKYMRKDWLCTTSKAIVSAISNARRAGYIVAVEDDHE
jgi:hypothetical protein